MNNSLQKYVNLFTRLKRGNTLMGFAPHKPVLLLTILQLFDKGLITENRIKINADLVGTFKENWLSLVPTLHQADFTQPFYYLQNDQLKGERFWFLRANRGYSINNHIKSVKVLADVCECAFLADDLYLLLLDTHSNTILKQVLLLTYFTATKDRFQKNREYGYMAEMEGYILNEPEIRLANSNYTEEDVFVRNGLFKKWVPKIYNRSCAFTGMKLESIYNHTFIDACHIVPFSVCQDDKVTNGIALCPNMHRAFDRGLLTVDEQYKILISPHLSEDSFHPYGLKQLNHKKIILPQVKSAQPLIANFQWHRTNVFKE